MSSEFNPYREWLSIPVSEQPANYYRLLGLPLFESDPDIISNAADRQMTFIRTFQTGKYSQHSQKLLNELAAARVTLLDKQKKAQYDAKLRSGNNLNLHLSPLNNTPPSSTPSPTPSSTPSRTPLQGQPAPNRTPSSTPSRTPLQGQPIPNRTPSSTPSRTPLRAQPAPNRTPSSTPNRTPSSTPNRTPLRGQPAPNRTPLSKNKAVSSPKPSQRSKSTQKSPVLKTSFFRRSWIVILISVIVIPLFLFGGIWILFHSNSSSQAKSQFEPGERKMIEVDGMKIAFRWCPPGTFMMGSPLSEDNHRPREKQHQVILTQGFWMMETEVTYGLFKAFVDETEYVSKGKTPFGNLNNQWIQNTQFSWRYPGYNQEDNHPVTCVSWHDAVEFCKWLSKKTGQDFSLPTESQWEYACRAGTTDAYAGKLNEIAWHVGINQQVGMKKPNAWGLYDMHGNVQEWCEDWDGEYPDGSVTDPVGPSYGSKRMIRGGCVGRFDWACRSAYRESGAPESRGTDLGFRVLTYQ